jgi:hypothetical protein
MPRCDQLSFYDVAPLRATLERLVDFDRLNAGAMRFSVGAVNVKTAAQRLPMLWNFTFSALGWS